MKRKRAPNGATGRPSSGGITTRESLGCSSFSSSTGKQSNKGMNSKSHPMLSVPPFSDSYYEQRLLLLLPLCER